MSQCRRLNDHRVRIVHGFWGDDPFEDRYLYHLSRQSLQLEGYYADHEEVTKLANEAAQLYIDFEAWLAGLPSGVRPERTA
jgi:hypothetical protein